MVITVASRKNDPLGGARSYEFSKDNGNPKKTATLRLLVRVLRAANNGWSTDNIKSELGIDQINPWIAGHFARFFTVTGSFWEILIFNYRKSFDQPKTGRIRAKTCLTGQRDRPAAPAR